MRYFGGLNKKEKNYIHRILTYYWTNLNTYRRRITVEFRCALVILQVLEAIL